MHIFFVGQGVVLRSGKRGKIIARLPGATYDKQYRIELEDRQTIVLREIDIVGLAGPQVIRVDPTQCILYVPANENNIQQHKVTKVKNAFTNAFQRLNRAEIAIMEARSDVEVGMLPNVVMQTALLAAFRLRPPSAPSVKTLVDYSRLLVHASDLIKVTRKGLMTDGLAIYEVPQTVLVKNPRVGGFVPLNITESITYYLGAWTFHNFRNVQKMDGEIHINLESLAGEWECTQTLIHEATHKFGRTIDHIYLSKSYYNSIAPLFLTNTLNAKSQYTGKSVLDTLEETQTSIGGSSSGDNKTLATVTPMELADNADSFAMFFMWLTDH